ncbi:hypothetical protein EKK58_03525 [Candidatus Dependentiae bacterium]|nr:MAG: hypothetical protein EKK58_03525 [Candidatus Dependentiae bacterium]
MFLILLLSACYFIHFTNDMYAKQIKKVVLIAGGQGSTTSRTIGDYYESGLTLAFCNALSEAIKEKNNTIIVTIVKAATFNKSRAFCLAEDINKKNPHLAIHVGLYAQPEEVPCIHFFYYGHGYDPVIKNNTTTLPKFISLREAHIINSKKTYAAVTHAAKAIEPYVREGLYMMLPPKKVPFFPLKGILPSSFACEIGIEKPNDWKKLVHDIADTFIAACMDV